MNNRVKKIKFGNTKGHMKNALRNMSLNLIKNEHLTTTRRKAKSVLAFTENLLSKYTPDDSGKRYMHKLLGTLSVKDKMDELVNGRLNNVNSGFVSMYRVGPRLGDGAEMYKVVLNGYEVAQKSRLTKVKNEVKTETKSDKKDSE